MNQRNRRSKLEIEVDVAQDEERGLRTLRNTAKRLRLSEDTKIAATGAKYEALIHEHLELVLGGKAKRKKEASDSHSGV